MIQAINTTDVITPQPSYSDVTMNQPGDVNSSNTTSPSSANISYQSPFLPPHNKFSPTTASSIPSNRPSDVRFPRDPTPYKFPLAVEPPTGGYFPPPPCTFTPPSTSFNPIPPQPQLMVSLVNKVMSSSQSLFGLAM